ncbi:MAG: hypothetical protein Q8Q73_05800 [Stagnimonas sp.]|nr:hypothetical protein [Stagnimonas sp.]
MSTPSRSQPTAAAPLPTKLRSLSAPALDELFDRLPAPGADELRGDYPGSVLTGAGFEALAPWLRPLLRAFAAWLWRAKSFAPGQGINLWWSPLRPLRRLPYRCYLQASALGGGEVLVLDYDLAGNPAPARRVRGELRRLAPDHYLGRMLLRRRGGGARLVTYFSLRRGQAGG